MKRNEQMKKTQKRKKLCLLKKGERKIKAENDFICIL